MFRPPAPVIRGRAAACKPSCSSSRALTPTLSDTGLSRELAALSAARPGSSPVVSNTLAHCHRRGRRSTAAILKRANTRRERFQRFGEKSLDDDRTSADDNVVNDNVQENREELPPRRSGQPRPPTLMISDTFSIFHLNPQGIENSIKLAKFDTLIQQFQQPTVVGVTETWLDESTKAWTLSGYTRVSRLDRRVGHPGRGGIALFALDRFAENIVHIADSPVDERSWHIIHCDTGPVLLCLWYRPPHRNEEVDSIRRFDQELGLYSRDTVACIVIGDMNVHNTEWLIHSNGCKRAGVELETVCCTHGLKQHVRDPTRGPYLLDLVLSNFSSGIQCKVLPGVKADDHDGVLTTVNVSVPSSSPVRRQVYDFKHANWDRLKSRLSQVQWGVALAERSVDDAAAWLTSTILEIVNACVPSKWIIDKSYAHPWMNDECREALQRKQDARNTPLYPSERDACSAVFLNAYKQYVVKTRETLRKMEPSSKGWWKIANSLLTKRSTVESIPALQRQDGSWAMSAGERANELATTFRSKSNLPSASVNEYSEIHTPQREPQSGFLRLRVRTVQKLLRSLDERSGTGPDQLPARILKKCCAELALPVTLLARKLLDEGQWPACWRQHWVHPIFKRKSRADAKNYRGVHLTAQLSKIVERALGSVFIPWAEANSLHGPNQYAYIKGKSYKDTLAVNVCNWLLLMEHGHAVGLYCSDVAGAFDRVDKKRLRAKLSATGLHPKIVNLLASWLEDRTASVVVGGEASPVEPLTNSVFQGTVLGPPLWNIFYEDARHAVNCKGYIESVFADDFNCWKPFKLRHSAVASDQGHALHDLQEVQRELHKWGAANRVIFDPSKESFHLLHSRFQHGDDFKLLGVVFDTQLLMHRAAREIATEAGWRLQTLLKVRRFFTTPEIFRLYKAQVLSYIEGCTPAIFHAAPSVLDRIDRVQRRFLREMGFTEAEALELYSLAPLPCRRDMAMLGTLHKITLGLAPHQLSALFPILGTVSEPLMARRLRGWKPRHDRQLGTPASFMSSDRMKRSMFGLCRCYNLLPQELVSLPSVKLLQRHLQMGLRRCAQTGSEDWHELLSQKWSRLPRQDFHALFS